MKDYRHGSHTLYDIRLHVVWSTKYRYPVLIGKTALRTQELIRQICQAHEVTILGGVVSTDHVHLHVSVPPQLAPSELVMRLKGRTSRRIQEEFPESRKRYWGQHFWARGYFCVSAGNVTDDMIREYLAGHADKGGGEMSVEGAGL